MQKLINVLALASFGVSAAIVAGGGWVYVNRVKLVDDAKEMAMDQVMEVVPGLISGALAPSLPELPGLGGDGESSSPVEIPTLPFGM